MDISDIDRVVDKWTKDIEGQLETMAKMKEMHELINEPAMEKHIYSLANDILVKQRCIIDIRSQAISELAEKKERGSV